MVNMWYVCLIVFWGILLASCQPSGQMKVEKKTEDGKMLATFVIDTANGKLDTLEKTEYYPNGQIRIKGTYKNNKRDGEWIYYFEDGKVWSQGTFKDGKSDGVFTVYNKDGSLFMRSSYKNGKPDGKWLFYENNRLKKEVVFANDSIIKEIDY